MILASRSYNMAYHDYIAQAFEWIGHLYRQWGRESDPSVEVLEKLTYNRLLRRWKGLQLVCAGLFQVQHLRTYRRYFVSQLKTDTVGELNWRCNLWVVLELCALDRGNEGRTSQNCECPKQPNVAILVSRVRLSQSNQYGWQWVTLTAKNMSLVRLKVFVCSGMRVFVRCTLSGSSLLSPRNI